MREARIPVSKENFSRAAAFLYSEGSSTHSLIAGGKTNYRKVSRAAVALQGEGSSNGAQDERIYEIPGGERGECGGRKRKGEEQALDATSRVGDFGEKVERLNKAGLFSHGFLRCLSLSTSACVCVFVCAHTRVIACCTGLRKIESHVPCLLCSCIYSYMMP